MWPTEQIEIFGLGVGEAQHGGQPVLSLPKRPPHECSSASLSAFATASSMGPTI